MNGNMLPPDFQNMPDPQMMPNMQAMPPNMSQYPQMTPPDMAQYPQMPPNMQMIPPREMAQYSQMAQTKFCPSCGSVIPSAAVICTNCGCQAGTLQAPVQQPMMQQPMPNMMMYQQPNAALNANGVYRAPKDKWVAFLLCLFLGFLGGHKYYEGKVGLGLLYLFTGGLFGIGWLIDLILILCKKNPYYDY